MDILVTLQHMSLGAIVRQVFVHLWFSVHNYREMAGIRGGQKH